MRHGRQPGIVETEITGRLRPPPTMRLPFFLPAMRRRSGRLPAVTLWTATTEPPAEGDKPPGQF